MPVLCKVELVCLSFLIGWPQIMCAVGFFCENFTRLPYFESESLQPGWGSAAKAMRVILVVPK